MKQSNQRGFTLIELLIALALVLVVLVGVQRYIAGVTIDQQGISERRSQATQTRIALSNMQRDVAQAGYVPYADEFIPTSPVGVLAIKNTLTVASYQPAATARDCNNAGKNYAQTGWVYVENIYKISEGSLACDGNGGDNGALKVLDDVQQMIVTNSIADSFAAIDNVQMVNVCIITSESSVSIGGVPTTTMCDGAAITPKPDITYFKIIADMPVYRSSFKAGQ